LTTIAGVLLQQ